MIRPRPFVAGLMVSVVLWSGRSLLSADGRIQGDALAPITEAQARAWAVTAANGAAGKLSAFEKTFESLVRKVRPGYDATRLLFYQELFFSSQVAEFQDHASDAFRFHRPLGNAVWPAGPVLHVEPEGEKTQDRLGNKALDITTIVLRRAGVIVEPLSGRLERATYRAGPDQIVLHHGVLIYPSDAFVPGAPVTVELTAAASPKPFSHVITLSPAQLKKLR